MKKHKLINFMLGKDISYLEILLRILVFSLIFISGTFAFVTFTSDDYFILNDLSLFLVYSFIFLVIPILTLILFTLILRFVLEVYRKFYKK